MASHRRDFIRGVGTTLAAMLAGGCATCYTPTPTCYAPTVWPPPPTRTPGLPYAGEQWNAMRSCWLDLTKATTPVPAGKDTYRDLRLRHSSALTALVGGGELRRGVADQLQAAFDGAITYLQFGAGDVTPFPALYSVHRDLAAQAAALAEMAQRSDISQDTVGRARASLERDMAWLALLQGTPVPNAEAEFSGDASGRPTADEIEAARILVELLLAREQ